MKTDINNVIGLVTKLNNLGVYIENVNGQLKINAPKGVLSADILEEIKYNKRDLLNFLSKKVVKKVHTGISCAEKKEYYNLSSSQKRIYILQQMDISSTAYNMPQLLPINDINIDELKVVVEKIIQKHESFRISFELYNDNPKQKIVENLSYDIDLFEIKNTKEIDSVFVQFVKPFKLNEAPLFRVALIKEKEGKCYLLVDMHHIISDGISMELLRKDLINLLNRKSIKYSRLQYKDYSEWQNSKLNDIETKKQEDYWLEIFSNNIPTLDLPYDFPRPETQSYEGATVSFLLGKSITSKIRELCKKSNSTISMTLLALYNILLSKITGQQDIVVGLPIAGRSHPDLEKIIGIFVNTIPLRNYPKYDLCFNDFLKDLVSRTLSAYENQDYQFEDLVEKLNITRDFSRNPIFDTMFNVLNVGDLQDNFQNSQNDLVHVKSVAKFDLILDVVETKDDIVISFVYCIRLFKSETIDKIITYFKEIVNQVINNTSITINEIIVAKENVSLIDSQYGDSFGNF